MMADDQVTAMIPGMAEALDEWLAAYHALYIEGGAPVNDSDRYARGQQEAGLIGRAFAIIFQVQVNSRRAGLALAPEPFRQPGRHGEPLTAGLHPFADPPAPRGTGHDL